MRGPHVIDSVGGSPVFLGLRREFLRCAFCSVLLGGVVLAFRKSTDRGRSFGAHVSWVADLYQNVLDESGTYLRCGMNLDKSLESKYTNRQANYTF